MATAEWIARSRLRASPVGDEDGADGVSRLFDGREVHDGTGMIALGLPPLVERAAPVSVSVEVNWPMVLAKAVARLYLIADRNRDPLLARVALLPDVVPPHVCLSVRLDGATYVRAIVECGDGTLLGVKRWVWVMPPDGEGGIARWGNGRP